MNNTMIGILVFGAIWCFCSSIMINYDCYPYDPELQKKIYGRVLSEKEFEEVITVFNILKRTPWSIVMLISLVRSKFKENLRVMHE